MDSKVCTRCKESKAPAEYRKRSAAKDGLYGQCRTCESAVRKAKYRASKNPDNKTKYHGSIHVAQIPDPFDRLLAAITIQAVKDAQRGDEEAALFVEDVREFLTPSTVANKWGKSVPW